LNGSAVFFIRGMLVTDRQQPSDALLGMTTSLERREEVELTVFIAHT